MGITRELVGDAGAWRPLQRGAPVISKAHPEEGVLPDQVPPGEARHCPLASDKVAVGFLEPYPPARTGQGQDGQQGQTVDEETAPPIPGQADAGHCDQEGRGEQRRPGIGEHDATQTGEAESCGQEAPPGGDRPHPGRKRWAERGHRGMGQSQSVEEESPCCKVLLVPKRLTNAIHGKAQERGHREGPARLMLDEGQEQGEEPAGEKCDLHRGPSDHRVAEECGRHQGGGVETMEPQSRRRKARHPVQPGHQRGDGLPAGESECQEHGPPDLGSE
jgi:hypothetical protein